jgi:uncharacterized protein YraI
MTSPSRGRSGIARALRRSGVVITAAAVVLGVLAAPASANTGGTINSGGSYVNVRSGPGTDYSIVGTLAQGTGVSVYCVYDNGTAVSGPFGTTKLWDQIGGGRWVTDAFVNTGTNNPIAMPCGGGYGEAFRHGGPEPTDVYAIANCYFVNGGSGTNFGASSTPAADWYQYGTDCSGFSYMYTFGHGSTPTSDRTRWGYFPGAYATCTISVTFPWNEGSYSFDHSAHYQVLTNRASNQVLSNQTYDQQSRQGQTVSLGTFHADGTGYLAVTLDDSSGGQTGVRVVAQLVSFGCTSSF